MPVSQEQIRIALETLFNASFSACPVSYPNNRINPKGLALWASFNILDADRFREYMRGPLGEGLTQSGFVTIQLFAKPDTGTSGITAAVDSVISIFPDGLNVTVAGNTTPIIFKPARKNTIGETAQGGTPWYQINVDCPWEHGEI